MTNPGSPHVDPVDALRRFFDVPLRGQTYRNVAYLALSFPLGLAYFIGVTTGLSMGVGLLVTVVGIPVLILTLVGATMIAGFEASLARWLLDLDVASPRGVDDIGDTSIPLDLSGLLNRLQAFLSSPTTWTSIVLVLLKFVFGLVAFVALVTYGAIVVSMLSAPFLFDVSSVTYLVGPFTVDTLSESVMVSIVGILLLFVGLHVLNGLARLFGLATMTLLGRRNEAPDTVSGGTDAH